MKLIITSGYNNKKKHAISLLFLLLFYFYILQGAVYTPLDLRNIEASKHKLANQAQSVAAYIRRSNVTYDC